MPDSHVSVSTWRQPEPPPGAPQREALLADVSRQIDELRPGRLRIGIDGFTASGKSTFGRELARHLRALGRTTLRASLDDFKGPWSERHL